MAHECGCHSGSSMMSDDREVRADDVVGDVARRSDAALQILRDSGIDHCCGAYLTLTEAAAVAGVPLDALLRALNESRRTSAWSSAS